MIKISLTAWFGNDALDQMLCGNGVVGHLTQEQYEKARVWIMQMAEWTDENREKDGEHDED